jgi:hypothetical protein
MDDHEPPPPPDRPERLSIVAAVLLVAVGQFVARVAAAALVMPAWTAC